MENKYGVGKRPEIEQQISLQKKSYASGEKKMEEEDPERREELLDLAKELNDKKSGGIRRAQGN